MSDTVVALDTSNTQSTGWTAEKKREYMREYMRNKNRDKNKKVSLSFQFNDEDLKEEFLSSLDTLSEEYDFTYNRFSLGRKVSST